MAQDARAYLRETLRQFGLESLVNWAFERLNEGTSEAQILLDLRQQPVYKQRFPAMEALSKKNRAFSEAEYVAYEKQTAGLMNMYGLPAGFYDSPDDFAQLIEKEVSVNELQSRIAVAAEASQKASSEIKAQLKRFYDVSEGDITAYFLDPTIAAPLLEQRFTAAKIGAASRTSRFGDVTSQEAEQVASLAPQNYQEKLSKFSEEQDEHNYVKSINRSLDIQSKKQYIEKKHIHCNFIDFPEEYFKAKGVWTNWYDFIGVDTTKFIQSKQDWINFCKEKNIKSLDEYYKSCEIYEVLPKDPADFYYKDFTNIPTELGFNRTRR